jgi:acyl carrier protein
MDVSEKYQRMAAPQDVRDILRVATVTKAREELDVESPYIAPATGTEQQLAEIWTEVLLITGIGLDDNFFELAGDSLQMTQMMARIIARWGVEVPIETFFIGPTIRELAAFVDDAARGRGPA